MLVTSISCYFLKLYLWNPAPTLLMKEYSAHIGIKNSQMLVCNKVYFFNIVVFSVLDLVGLYLKKSKNVMSALFTANSSANRMYRCTMVFGPLPDVLERCSTYRNDYQRLNFSAGKIQTPSTTHDHRRTGQWSRRFIRVIPANMHINRYLFDCFWRQRI